MAFVWELVKNNNSFIRKGRNGIILSAEPGNLYSKHSYKYSGRSWLSDNCESSWTPVASSCTFD
jgi:hypothetical protein